MYFPLEINEQLANAMRAAAEFKVEVEKIIECVCIDKIALKDSKKEYEEMSDDICTMIVSIGRTMGLMLSEIVLNEVNKLNPCNNQPNTKDHVSE